jgi:hypothetical protein
VQLPKLPRDQLQLAIQQRPVEIAAGEGDNVVIPVPAITVLREPTGLFGVHWALADWQDPHGLPYIKVAAAEATARWDVVTN